MTDKQNSIASTSSSIHSKAQEPSSDISRLSTRDTTADDSDSDLLDELEADLENDFDLGGFRERRLEELKAQIDRIQKMKESDYGRYSTYKDEKQIISTTAKAPRSLVHFFHPDFRRCKIMDGHLEKLATKHTDTLFLRADVANVPFLVTKLEIKVLPCVIGFVNGVSKLKIVGFEELPGEDNFSTASLEAGLIESGVISVAPGQGVLGRLTGEALLKPRSQIRGAASYNEDSD